MAPVRQASFAGGELAPTLWGRTDSARYAKGLRVCRDTIISKHGQAVSRPGTRLVGLANANMVSPSSDHSHPVTPVVAGGRIRLIPFYFSDTDSSQNYVLEFGEQYFNIWQNGVRIHNTYYGSPAAYLGGKVYHPGDEVTFNGSIYESLVEGNIGNQPDTSPAFWNNLGAFANENGSTPYHAGDLYKIRYVQSADTLYLACAGYPPMMIERTDATRFAFSEMSFDAPAPPSYVDPRLEEDLLRGASTTEPAQPWSVAVTVLTTDANGQVMESSPVTMTKAFIKPGASWVSFLGYKSGTWISGIYAFDTGSGTITTKVWKQAQRANQGQDPANDTTGDGNADWGPSTTAEPIHDPDYIDQDDGYTGSLVVYPDNPAVYRLYQPGSSLPSNFVSFRIYRGQSGVLGWVGDSAGQFFTDYGVTPDLTRQPPQGTNPFVVKNGDGTVIRTETPISVGFFEDRLTFFGTEERSATVFQSQTGDYQNFDQPFIPPDSSAVEYTLAARRFELARWCLGKDKLFLGTNSQIWAAGGSNGPIAPTNVEAHVQADVGSGWVAPIIVGNKLLFVRDKGTAVRGIEFDFSKGSYTAEDVSFGAEHLFLGHIIVDWCYADDPWAQIWAVREDGIVLAGVWCQDDEMWAWTQHRLCVDNDGDPQQVLSVCTIPEDGYDAVYFAIADPNGNNPAWIVRMGPRLELDDEALEITGPTGGGLEYGLGMGLGETTPGSLPPVNQVGAGTPICLDAWVFAAGPFPVSFGIVTFHGLNYLAGRNVYLILDGVIYTGTVASNGDVGVTGLSAAVNNAWIGLGYLPEGELLDLADARNKMKMVGDVSLEVKANGTIEVGSNFASLEPFPPPSGTDDDEVRGLVNGQWTYAGRCCWRQVLPLPLTVRAVTREVAVGSI